MRFLNLQCFDDLSTIPNIAEVFVIILKKLKAYCENGTEPDRNPVREHIYILVIIVIVFHLHLSNVRFNLTAKIAMSEGYSVRCNQKFYAKRGTGLKKYTTAGGEYQVWSYLTCSIFLSFLKKIPRCMARILYLVQEC